jgi:crotonobetainyl-CoA:carnitine CoA-transferase CaiB-like acyl-CoA transferase
VRLSAQSSRPAEYVPALGEHTAVLLDELGYGAAAVEELRERGAV